MGKQTGKSKGNGKKKGIHLSLGFDGGDGKSPAGFSCDVKQVSRDKIVLTCTTQYDEDEEEDAENTLSGAPDEAEDGEEEDTGNED